MSKGNNKGHKRADMDHPRGNITHAKPGEYTGSKYVKKAGMTVTYTCWNKPNKADLFIWE